MKSLLVLAFSLVLILLGLGLGLSNTTPVSLAFMGIRSPELPLIFWLFLAVALGAVVAGLLCGWRSMGLKREIRRLRRFTGKR